MKKFGLLFSILILVSQLAWGQLLIENFNYPVGDSLTAHGWSLIGSNYINNCNVSNSGLIFTNYAGSNTGISLGAQINNLSNAEEVGLGFNSQTSGKVYFSFLVNISYAPNPSTPSGANAFIGLNNSVSSTTYPVRVVAKNPSGSLLNFGVVRGANATNAVMGTTNFSINTTYLIVLKYSFISGTANDSLKLFVFNSPSLPSSEPSIPEVATNTGGTDASEIAAIFLRQDNTGSSCIVDGIRVATEWSQAPLPVELSSFSASVVGNAVKLNWKTETEVNNYGFDIERSLPQPLPKEGAFGTPLPLGKGQGDGLWTKIGFVNGNGNSNSPKSYTFTDANVLSGKYSYRLKQIDNDGQFEYSKTIEVDLGAPGKFELAQNFPNPFNPETAIRFTLPTAGNVRLTIYNLLGQEVKSLVNAFKEAGTHIINFNASEFNSGVYIYKLEANGITQTRKMTLIK